MFKYHSPNNTIECDSVNITKLNTGHNHSEIWISSMAAQLSGGASVIGTGLSFIGGILDSSRIGLTNIPDSLDLAYSRA